MWEKDYAHDERSQEQQQAHLRDLMEVAAVVRDDPRRRLLLDKVITGDIHRVFWW